jgi:hypothetical protein
MNFKTLASFASFLFPIALGAQTGTPPTNILNPEGSNLEDAYQINYVSNLNMGDGVVTFTNSGTSAGATAPGSSSNSGSMCLNLYLYSPAQQPLKCCYCAVNPNALHSWPVIYGSDALLNGVPNPPTSVVIKLIATSPGTDPNSGAPVCDPTFLNAPLSLIPGLTAWGTHSHPSNTPTVAISETEFQNMPLSLGEAAKLESDCSGLGSAGRQCSACASGALAQPAKVAYEVEQRRHTLADGFAILGPWSQPRVLANYSTSSAQLRNDAGTTVIDVAQNQVTVTAQTAQINTSGNATVNASGTATVEGNTVNITGSSNVTIGSNVKIDNRVFLQHTHSGVQTGSGVSGPVV